jgi:hypothetical protein
MKEMLLQFLSSLFVALTLLAAFIGDLGFPDLFGIPAK